MPRWTATDCAIIKRNPRYAHVPVIMLSSKDGLFDKARGRMVGFAGLPHQALHQGTAAACGGVVPPRRR